jgi:hypothetical protein
MTFDIFLHTKRERVAAAEADSPEAAMLAARTLWDDHIEAHPYQGVHRSLTVYVMLDGVLAGMSEGQRP